MAVNRKKNRSAAGIESSDRYQNEKGMAAILIMLIIMGLILIVTLSVSTIVFTKKQLSRNYLASVQSYYSAESGIEDSVMRVLKGLNYTATNSVTLGGAAVSQSISEAGNVNTIESDALYSGNKRKLKTLLTITTTNISFHYGVQVGEGGLTMNNNSEISGNPVGNLYSDGSVIGAPGAEITGDVYVATGMSLDHTWTVYNAERDFGTNPSVLDVSQSFVPTTTNKLSQVSFYLKRTNGIPSDGTIRVVTDNSGSPSKTEIASTTLAASSIGTTYSWVNYSFSSPATLTAGTKYWIILDASEHSSKYYYIGKDSNKGNGNGVSKYSADWNAGSPVWIEDTGDFDFKTFMGGQATSLNQVIVGLDAHANTITNSTIGKDAYYQTISGSTVSGASYPGSPDPAVEALPISAGNITDWETDATAGGIYSDAAHCQPADGAIIGPAQLNCNFVPQSNAVVTIKGTIWVRGNITVDNGAALQLDSGYALKSGVIIADYPGNTANSGQIELNNNVKICGSPGYNTGTHDCNPSNGSNVLILSTYSNLANYAVNVSNNGNGAIFYASAGAIYVANNAHLKEVTGYKLILAPNAEVEYESGLANSKFTSGPGAGWMINSWNEVQ